jgi:hypothetical protein
VLQVSLLLRYASPAVAEAFSSSRLEREHRGAFGELTSRVDLGAVVERAEVEAGAGEDAVAPPGTHVGALSAANRASRAHVTG